MDGSYPGCSFHTQQRLPERQRPTGAHPPLPSQETPAPTTNQTTMMAPPAPKPLTPREMRNRAEKQRRHDMSQSINRLASIIPAVVKSGKKMDKTSILRYAAHYLRSHKHVFDVTQVHSPTFSGNFVCTLLQTMKGFLLTATYKGLLVVVSPNIQQYLGYTEIELLGKSLFSIVHKDDHQLLREQLYPRSCKLTCNGQLLLSEDENAAKEAAEALKNETRAFLIRIKKVTRHRSDPIQYLTCHVEGSFRKSDGAGVYVDRPVTRRARARGKNPYASGNDVVFVGMVRPIIDTFATEKRIDEFTMEYRTRHSIDGCIMDCEQRIALATGYMVHEVKGVNAMNFMHRDDVRYVIIALRQMYVKHYLKGESCYRLVTKNGQFIYMRTSGTLDVDPVSKEATSFVCINTVVSEQEGKQLIEMMKQKFSNEIDDNYPMNKNVFAEQKVNEKQNSSVEDPKQLERVIYQLVTDLPSPPINRNTAKETNSGLSIIPPRKEQIKKAIEKSYSVIKTLRQLAPKTQLEKMIANQSQFTNGDNTRFKRDQNYPQPVPDNSQQFNQNPINVYHPGDFSWPNEPASTYVATTNSAEEEYGQPLLNEAQATVQHGDLNVQAGYNNPDPDRLYGATYYEDKTRNSNCSYSQVAYNNDEENLQYSQATADTNGMNALAYHLSEASNTLNGDFGVNASNSWVQYDQDISTEPQNHRDISEKPAGQKEIFNNINSNEDENSDFVLSPMLDEYIDTMLLDKDLIKTAALASQSLMSEEPINTENVDRSSKSKDKEFSEIWEELNQIMGINPNINQGDSLRQGPWDPVAAEESAASTLQNHFYMEQPPPVNRNASLDPYEFKDHEPTDLTGRKLSYRHAGEQPSSDTDDTCKTT